VVVLLCVGFGGPGSGVVFGQGGCDLSLQSCQPDGQVSVDSGGGQTSTSGGQSGPAPLVSVDSGGQGQSGSSGGGQVRSGGGSGGGTQAAQPVVGVSVSPPAGCDSGSSCVGQLQSPSVKSVQDATVLDPSVGYLSTWLGGVEQGVLPVPVDSPGSHFGAYGQLGGVFRGCVDAGMNIDYGGVVRCDQSGTTCVLHCRAGTTAFNADVAGANSCTDTTLLVPVNSWVGNTGDPYICPPSYSYYPGRPQGGPGNLFPRIPELCFRNCDGNRAFIPPMILTSLDIAPLLTTPIFPSTETAATNDQIINTLDKTTHPIQTLINATAAYAVQTGADPDKAQTFRLQMTALTTVGLLALTTPGPGELTGTPTAFAPITPGFAIAPAAAGALETTTAPATALANIIFNKAVGNGSNSDTTDGNGAEVRHNGSNGSSDITSTQVTPDSPVTNILASSSSRPQLLAEALTEVGYGAGVEAADLRRTADQAVVFYNNKAVTAAIEAQRPSGRISLQAQVALTETAQLELDSLSSMVRDEGIASSKITPEGSKIILPNNFPNTGIISETPNGNVPFLYKSSTGYNVPLWFDPGARQWYTKLANDTVVQNWLKTLRLRQALSQME